jgi:hypothetical protein
VGLAGPVVAAAVALGAATCDDAHPLPTGTAVSIGATGGAGAGGETGAGVGGAMSGAGGAAAGGAGGTLPACVGVKNKAGCDSEPPCSMTCGPLKSGHKDCTCAGGIWSCPTCAFYPGNDYSCFALPATLQACVESRENVDPSGMRLPQSGDACTEPPCQACGSGTSNAYRDSSGSPRIGYCVCAVVPGAGQVYSCATPHDWPPQ